MGPLPVTVLEMQPRSVPNAVEIVAQTEGAKEAEVRARVGGILVKQLYQEGLPVKAGQPLFQIDRDPYEIAYAEAKANGFDTKILRQVISLRKKDAAEREEEESMLDVYMAALGMIPEESEEAA